MAPQPCAYGTFSNTDYYIYYSTGTNKIIRNTSENEDKTKKLSIHSISAPVILSAKIAKGESRGKKGKRCFTCIDFAERVLSYAKIVIKYLIRRHLCRKYQKIGAYNKTTNKTHLYNCGKPAIRQQRNYGSMEMLW